MYYHYNGEKYKIIFDYQFVSKIFERNHDSINKRLAKTAETAAYHSPYNDVRLFVYLFSNGITDFTIGLRNRIMRTFENSCDKDDVYYNTYRAIGNKIDDLDGQWSESSMYIPIALCVDNNTGGWVIYVDGELTDQFVPFVVETDDYIYPIQNLILTKEEKDGYINRMPKLCSIDDPGEREATIKSLDDFNQQVRKKLHIPDSKYLVNIAIIYTENYNVPDNPVDVFNRYFGDNGYTVYSKFIHDTCSMGTNKGKNNHILIIDIINDTDATVSIDDTIIAVLTK